MRKKSRDTGNRTPATLICALGSGDDDKWRTFHCLYGPVVYRLAMWNGLNATDAEDVTATVMARLFQRFRTGFRYDPANGRFRDYLATVTRREAHLQLRQTRRRAQSMNNLPESINADLQPEQQLADLEISTRLDLCLARLRASHVGARTLRVFDRYVLRGESAESVARRYGLKKQGVYDIRNRVIERLRTIMIQLQSELGEV